MWETWQVEEDQTLLRAVSSRPAGVSLLNVFKHMVSLFPSRSVNAFRARYYLLRELQAQGKPICFEANSGDSPFKYPSASKRETEKRTSTSAISGQPKPSSVFLFDNSASTPKLPIAPSSSILRSTPIRPLSRKVKVITNNENTTTSKRKYPSSQQSPSTTSSSSLSPSLSTLSSELLHRSPSSHGSTKFPTMNGSQVLPAFGITAINNNNNTNDLRLRVYHNQSYPYMPENNSFALKSTFQPLMDPIPPKMRTSRDLNPLKEPLLDPSKSSRPYSPPGKLPISPFKHNDAGTLIKQEHEHYLCDDQILARISSRLRDASILLVAKDGAQARRKLFNHGFRQIVTVAEYLSSIKASSPTMQSNNKRKEPSGDEDEDDEYSDDHDDEDNQEESTLSRPSIKALFLLDSPDQGPDWTGTCKACLDVLRSSASLQQTDEHKPFAQTVLVYTAAPLLQISHPKTPPRFCLGQFVYVLAVAYCRGTGHRLTCQPLFDTVAYGDAIDSLEDDPAGPLYHVEQEGQLGAVTVQYQQQQMFDDDQKATASSSSSLTNGRCLISSLLAS